MVGSNGGVKVQCSYIVVQTATLFVNYSLYGSLSKNINTILLGLYYFYHNSLLNRAMLTRSFTSGKEQNDKLDANQGWRHKMGRPAGANLTNLTLSYKFIVTHLEQVSINF